MIYKFKDLSKMAKSRSIASYKLGWLETHSDKLDNETIEQILLDNGV